MMQIKKHIFIPFFSFLFIFILVGCQSQDIPEIPVGEKEVYVSFQAGFAGASAITRAQGANPSVNSDQADEEDFVKKLAVLVFESGAGNTKVAEEYTTSSSFIMKMKPGTYDFYFIGNYIDAESVLKSKTKSQLDAYLQTGVAFTSTAGAKVSGTAFPMARVYRSQTITDQGGTFANPKPFNPQVGAVSEKQLKPVSLFGQDWQGSATQNTINLIRACAKISLSVGGAGKADVANIEYINAAQNYTFAQLNDLSSQPVASNLPFSFATPSATENIASRLYVPERLFASTEQKGWNRDKTTGADEPIGKVNYIQITMRSGKMYKIPVISNGPAAGSGGDYLAFARDNSKADYGIIRNNHYQYSITVPEDNKEILVRLNVLPWDLVTVNDYTHDAIVIDKPEISVNNLINGTTLQVKYGQEIPSIKFRLQSPVASVWKATITNGLDFEFVRDAANNILDYGSAVGSSGNYTYIKVKPRDGWHMEETHTTEFFITVDGKEVPLIVHTPSGDVTLFGAGNRFKIVQVNSNTMD